VSNLLKILPVVNSKMCARWALWLYGFMALWLYGFMALWLYGDERKIFYCNTNKEKCNSKENRIPFENQKKYIMEKEFLFLLCL